MLRPFAVGLGLIVALGLLLPRPVGGQGSAAGGLPADDFDIPGNDLPLGWTDASEGEVEVRFSRETRAPKQGTACWRVAVPYWDSGVAQVRRNGLTLRAGALYAVEIWLRGSGIAVPVTLSLRRTGAPGTVYLTGRFAVGREWRRCTLTGRIPVDDPDAALEVAIPGSGTLDLDAFRVFEGELPVEPDVSLPPPVRGNRIYNSSFELGAHGWNVPDQVSVVAGECPEGQSFVRAPAGADPLEARPFEARQGQPYSVTAHLRADGSDTRVIVALVELGGAVREERTFTLTREWRRYGFQASLPCNESALHVVSVRVLDTDDSFDVDGVQVEEGPAGDYRPIPFEVAPAVPRQARFPRPDSVLDVPVRFYAPAGTPEGTRLRYRLEGFYGEPVGADVFPLPVGPERGEISFRLRIPERGTLRLVVEAVQPDGITSRGEQILTALPPGDTRSNASSFFGTHGGISARGDWHGPAIAARAGIRWWRLDELSPFTAWAAVEPTAGRHVWYDREVDGLRARGFSLLGVLGRTPRWAGREPPGEAVDAGAWPPARTSDFTAYVREVTRHYRGRIDAYELWNEPWNRQSWAAPPAQYVAIARAGAAAVRAGDPAAVRVGGSFYPGDTGFMDQALARGLTGFLDAVSYHHYVSPEAASPGATGRDQVSQWARLVRGRVDLSGARRPPLWMTEGGAPSPPFAAWLGQESGARAAARALAKTLVLARASGVRRFFYYSVWQDRGAPRSYGSATRENWSLLDAAGDGKPTLPALATCVRFLEGAEPVARIESRGLRAYTFRRGSGSLLVLWSPTARAAAGEVTLRLTDRRLNAVNLMGNAVPYRETKGQVVLSVRNEPLFVEVPTLAPNVVQTALRQASLAFSAARGERP